MANLAGEMPKAVNPYKALSLPKTATAAEVKTAYKKFALKHHPGKNITHTEMQPLPYFPGIIEVSRAEMFAAAWIELVSAASSD